MVPRVLAVVLLCGGPAVAQTVSMQFVSGSVSASAGSQSRSAPSGTVFASDSDPFWGCSASAMAGSGISGTRVSVSANVTSTGTCGPPPFNFGMSASASATIVVRLTAPAPVAGSLTLSGGGLFSVVDVGNDGTAERFGQTLPIVVDTTGVEVRLGCSASARAPVVTFAGEAASVTFQPVPAGILTALAPCGPEVAAWWSVAGSTRRLDFLVHRSAVTPATFFVFGVTPLSLVVPPTGCELGTNILVPLQLPVGPGGSAKLFFTLQEPVPAVTLYVQFLHGVLQGGQELWHTSNRLELRL